jgi:S1/P1 Nuclease
LLGGTDPGQTADPQDALDLMATLPAADGKAAAVVEPVLWLIESFTLAQNVVYAKPVGSSAGPYALDQAYMDNALQTAKTKAALAGARLGNLLNDTLK